MKGELPTVPRLDAALLSDHREQHRRLDDALVGAPPAVSRLLTRFALRTTVAAAAHIRPTALGGTGPPLFPVPRRFLAASDRKRIEGTAVAYRHLDSRLAMIQLGYESPPALLPEAPYVLHALTEGRMDNPNETNPGMIRTVELDGDLPVAPRPAPKRDRCRALVDEAVRQANSTEVPATARAAWMLYVFGEIHPFADGNGRVARLLYLLVVGEDMPRTVDWGAIEQLRYHQQDWLQTLKDPDVAPSATQTTELSIAGARLMSERLQALTALVPAAGRRFEVAPPRPELLVAVWLRRTARLDDLSVDLERPYAELLGMAEELVVRGLLERVPTEEATVPARPSYGLAPDVQNAVNEIAAELEADTSRTS